MSLSAPSGISSTTADLSIGAFRTASGAVIPDATLRYRLYGDPTLARTRGAVLVFHALTGSADVDQWWGPLFGPGRALDPARHPVLAANLLGSCYGSSGPGTVVSGGFPSLTARDLAAAHIPLLEHLGIPRLALATGGSLGGMVALEWGLLSPVPVERLVVFAAPGRTSAQAIAWNAAQRLAIEADPDWQEGSYAPGRGPDRGLAAARAIAMITYRSIVEFDDRFGRRATRQPGRFDVEHYLRRHGDKLVARFDARSYVALMAAMDSHDIGDYAAAGARTAARVGEIIGVGIDTDILYYPWEVRDWVAGYVRGGANARYAEIRTPYGHDAFLIEFEQVEGVLRSEK
ncbi:MAG TPA: homoserine O-acetyltransferase [Gemmatimonadales bacterium]|nr:homoserine O-acetyltransferase [Gemmatimonadales bacterium]